MFNNKKIKIAVISFSAGAMVLCGLSKNVFAKMPFFTVVIGDKAFDLNYVNDKSNENYIKDIIVNNKNNEIYVKTSDEKWVKNSTSEEVSSNVIPEVTYISKDKGYKYLKGDGEKVDLKENDEGYRKVIKMEKNPLPQFESLKPNEDIVIMTTNKGIIKIKLFPQYAPKAVENFEKLSMKGYYNNVTFHRVIENFMIQGGDPTATGAGGKSIWNKPFEDEFTTDLHNFRGALCMANAGPNTNGSQFFIVQNNKASDYDIKAMEQSGEVVISKEQIEKYKEVGGTPWLDYKHTVFGQVIEGMDVVDNIAKVKTDINTKKLLENVIMEKIEIEKYRDGKKVDSNVEDKDSQDKSITSSQAIELIRNKFKIESQKEILVLNGGLKIVNGEKYYLVGMCKVHKQGVENLGSYCVNKDTKDIYEWDTTKGTLTLLK